MTNRLIKAFFILAALLISSAAYSQSVVYTQGNVSIIQYQDTWQITHGGEILAHGNHVIDVENLAPPVQDLINHYANLPVTKKRTLKKSLLAAAEPEEPEYLIKTHWNQGSPFNDLCPTIDGERVPAGCVTISSAQVLNYYKVCKPLNIDYNHTIYANVESPYMELINHEDNNYTYHCSYTYTPDFDKINSDDEEMAKFIFAVALSQKVYFDKDGSMTSYYTQCGAFDNRFGYDYDICENKDKMKDFIISAIKEKHPVIVSDNARNHSFIIDGFNELNGNFHINLGWGESEDGWYTTEIVGISNFTAAIIVCPSDPNSVKMQEVPCYFYAKAKDATQYTRYDVANIDGSKITYSPGGKTLHFKGGEYQYYFEYADGSTIAPKTTDIVTLAFYNPDIVVKGKYQKEPATLIVKSPCDIYFFHDIQMGYIEIRGVNFNDPDFGTYNFVIEMDNKEIPLTYNEKKNRHETILELEPSQKELYVKNKTTNQTIGSGPYPPNSITFSDSDINLKEGGWLTVIDGSPFGLKILENAIFSDQEIPCKSIELLIYFDGTYFKTEVISYKAENNAMNHTLTLKADNPDHGEVIGAGSYGRNSNVIVTALPKKGYCFYSWSDGNRNSTRNVLVDKDMELTAQFKKDEEVVHVNVELKGDYYNYSSHISGDGVYLKGETVLLKVNTELDFGGKAYVLTKWSDGHAENTRTFIAEEDITLTAFIDCYNIPTFQKQFPKYLHIVDSKQNETKYSFEQNNEENVYSNITLRKGIYSFYYEYQDGKTAAPICGGTVYFNRESSSFFSRIMQESATVSFSAELDCNLNFYYRGDINYIYSYSYWPSYITISTDPKTEYLQGEDLSCADGVLLITYNNGTTETTALENAEITGFDKTKIGEQTLTVKYLGLETTLIVTVSSKSEPEPNPEPNPQPEPEPNNPQPEPNPSTPVTALTEQIEINVWSYNHTIFIENAPDTEYKIIDLNGRVITTSKTKSTREEINVNNTGVLIVIIGNKSFKLAL